MLLAGRNRPPRAKPREVWLFRPNSGNVVAIEVHHFGPGRHKVTHEGLLRVTARIDFSECPQRTLAEVAAELCVTQRYLKAIEEDDTAGVPGLFFYKNFARQYAAILGVEQRLILPALDAIQAPEDAPRSPEIRVPNRLVQATNRHHIPDISMGWSVIGLLVVLLGCSGIYAWWKRVPQAPSAVTVLQRTLPVAMVGAPAPSRAEPVGQEPTQAGVQTVVQSGDATGVVL